MSSDSHPGYKVESLICILLVLANVSFSREKIGLKVLLLLGQVKHGVKTFGGT